MNNSNVNEFLHSIRGDEWRSKFHDSETKRENNRQGTSTKARWTTRAGTSLKGIVSDLGIGLKLLPDVRWFRVETQLPDELFGAFDVKRKEPAKLELIPFTNKKINRYVV